MPNYLLLKPRRKEDRWPYIVRLDDERTEDAGRNPKTGKALYICGDVVDNDGKVIQSKVKIKRTMVSVETVGVDADGKIMAPTTRQATDEREPKIGW